MTNYQSVTAPPMFTSRFKAVSDLAKREDVERAFCPVRTSLGLPRWIKGAAEWPYIEELTPRGFKAVSDPLRFGELYFARMESFGLEAIAAKLMEVYTHQTIGSWQATPREERLPLALLCFEDLDTPTFCHRRCFAAWWASRTGELIEERNTADALPVRAVRV
jgi:hypothetical protein